MPLSRTGGLKHMQSKKYFCHPQYILDEINKKFEPMLTRRVKAYSSSGSVV